MRTYFSPDGCVIDLDAVVGVRIYEGQSLDPRDEKDDLEPTYTPYWLVQAQLGSSLFTVARAETRQRADEEYARFVNAWTPL